MYLTSKIIQFDIESMLQKQLKEGRRVIFANDLDINNPEDVKALNDAISMEIDTDEISLVPTCSCGNLNTSSDDGVICEICNTRCESKLLSFEPNVWLRPLEFAPNFISPTFIRELLITLGLKSKFILYMTNKKVSADGMVDTSKLSYIKAIGYIDVMPEIQKILKKLDLYNAYVAYKKEIDDSIIKMDRKPKDKKLSGFFKALKTNMSLNKFVSRNKLSQEDAEILRKLRSKLFTRGSTARGLWAKLEQKLTALEDFERTYYWLYNNLDVLIRTAIPLLKPDKRDKALELLDRVINNPEEVYIKHLPLINRRFNSTDKSTKMREVASTYYSVKDVATPFMKNTIHTYSAYDISRYMGQAIYSSVTILDKLLTGMLADKEGVFRKHLFGSRGVFTFRGVIISFIDALAPDEIKMPWGMLLVVLRPHIINKLIKKGYSMNVIDVKLKTSVNRYDKEIDGILQELLDEGWDRCIYASLTRNPSQTHHSTIPLKITSYEKDPLITTISISPLSVVLGNGDLNFGNGE